MSRNFVNCLYITVFRNINHLFQFICFIKIAFHHYILCRWQKSILKTLLFKIKFYLNIGYVHLDKVKYSLSAIEKDRRECMYAILIIYLVGAEASKVIDAALKRK